jgi:RND family efflux transporter MFP subunit
MALRAREFNSTANDESAVPFQPESVRGIVMRRQFTCLLENAALALCIFVAGCSREPAAPAPEAPKVSVMHPEQREITTNLEFNGWLQANKIQEVRSRVRGHIDKVHFKDGQTVKKGELLFEIDPRPYQAALDGAKAQVAAADAAVKLAKAEHARNSFLIDKGAVSQQEFDVSFAKVGVTAAEKIKGERAVDRAQLDLDYSRVTAEIAGRISKAELTEGNLVNAGGSDPLLTTITSVDPIRVSFNVDEQTVQNYAHMLGKEGRSLTEALAELKDTKVPFTFALGNDKDFTHHGVLTFTDNRIDSSTGTIPTYGTVENKNGDLTPGARVRVRLPFGKPVKSLLVPETAILADQDKRYVLIIDDKNSARRRNVTLGALTDDSMRAIQPADKLTEGEDAAEWWVIVDNLQRVRINYPVDPQKPR